jgi:predicted ATPase
MRIDWLKIPNYRNLRNFEINFDETQPTTVLLGHNGSGKSNLQEAIVEIFRELESAKPASFAYSIKYFCYDNTIEVDADPEASKKLKITINGKPITQTEFNRKKDDYLPQYIFGYYSGWSSRLERQFDEKTRRYYDEVLRNSDNDMPLRRFFFCRKDYSQLVLLAFFLENDPKARKLISDYLDIEGFESALFVMRRPWWGRSGRVRDEEQIDPRFWNARGAFRPFLSRLWEGALAPIRNTEAVERDIRHRGETTERIYLFIKNEKQLFELRNNQRESTKSFFSNLESLFLCDLIDEVRVKVRKKDGNKVTFYELSEGEQQLLTVLGLLLFTQDDESLYLLDEPDTHLNPTWTYQYLKLLQDNIRSEKGQLLVTTHDPLMISSLYKNQVRILAQQEGTTVANEPEYDPMGIGIEGLLKSELYGLRSTLAPEILEKLDRHYFLLGKEDKTDQEQSELMQIAQELNEMGVSRTHPNPYFDQFASAMARQTPTPDVELTKNEIAEQTKLADEILDEILAEEKESQGDEKQ